MRSELKPGEVVLVGGGPGDPDLITVAGLRAIRQADVIAYDHLSPAEVLADARPGAELVGVGKIPRGRGTPQTEINALLVDRAQRGLRVVRLKGGDNFVFGRGGEECEACIEAGIAVRVIPGVTSAVAVPAVAGIPLTHRALTQAFTVVSGHVPPDDERSTLDWDAIARANTTIVILMGVHNLAAITDRLKSAGLPPSTPAGIVCRGTRDDEFVLRGSLTDIAQRASDDGVVPPAIVVVGAVAALDLTSR